MVLLLLPSPPPLFRLHQDILSPSLLWQPLLNRLCFSGSGFSSPPPPQQRQQRRKRNFDSGVASTGNAGAGFGGGKSKSGIRRAREEGGLVDPIVEEKEEREKEDKFSFYLCHSEILETHFCPGSVQRRIYLPATTLSLSSSSNILLYSSSGKKTAFFLLLL